MGQGLELRGRRRGGTQFPVDIALSHTDTEDGPLVIAAVRDMTDRNKTEEGRRHSDQLAAIVEHSDDAIIGNTLDGIVTSWNPAAERMYGYSAEEITGKSIDLLSPHGQAGEMHTILARIRAGQPVERLQTTRIRKDGSAITVSLTVSAIHDRHGAIIGASTIARDMTEQREASEAARSMMESSLDSLVAISPEGKITDANQATVRLTGVPRDQLIGTSFSDYFTDPAKAEAIYQQVFTQGMAVDYPLTLRHHNGHETLTEVLYNASVYRDAAGKVLGVFAAARDVTEQMQAQRESAERQARELDRLAELERFQRLTVGRELKMIVLKKEIEYLKKLGTTEHGEFDGQA
jgi:PAS domain S-box-containing protein